MSDHKVGARDEWVAAQSHATIAVWLSRIALRVRFAFVIVR
jgi:hypothetical protein